MGSACSRRLRCASWVCCFVADMSPGAFSVLDERLLAQPSNSIDDDAFEGTKWHR
eukprot:EC789257.1.p4 GENE.EC789257.1~~EC789257.1.p4  ORF type:complete len:55 (+),score=5.28 EC789257.1:359-523(+)